MTNKKNSKNHHYVPESIVKKFAFSGNSVLLFDGERPELGYRQRNSRKVFQKFHANTISTVDGGKSDYVERWLAQNIDDPIAVLLNKSVGREKILFERESRKTLMDYLSTLIVRSPNAKEALFQDNADAFNTASSIFSLVQSMSPSTIAEVFGGDTPENLSDALKIALPTFLGDIASEIFSEAQLTLCLSPPGYDVFCLGDFPLMRYDDYRNASDGMCHEAWFILSPHLAACFFFRTTLDLEGRISVLPKNYIRKLNYDFAM